jgi:uncharacterized membrane protein|tara:strand:- start:23 stop:592 length:570 start_codon:yes stop_codon:yes gene_type:complete
MKKLKKYFLNGLLYIVPMAVTFWVLIESYKFLNGIIGNHLPENLQFPGLGLIAIVVLITIIGFVGSVIIASPINSFFQRLLKQAPLLQTIYSSVKDLMSTFVGKKKGFNTPVLIKIYENSTIERIGFITNKDLSTLQIKEGKVLVYLPHSFAFSGQLFVVERSYIKPIDASSAEIMKLIVSGGVTEIEN